MFLNYLVNSDKSNRLIGFMFVVTSVLFMAAYLLSDKIRHAENPTDQQYYISTSYNLYVAGIVIFSISLTLALLKFSLSENKFPRISA